MTTEDRVEFEAHMITQQFRSVPSLDVLIAAWLHPILAPGRHRDEDLELD